MLAQQMGHQHQMRSKKSSILELALTTTSSSREQKVRLPVKTKTKVLAQLCFPKYRSGCRRRSFQGKVDDLRRLLTHRMR